MAGADANPYLALAALLAGVHHGLTQKLDPGPPVVGDGYAAAAESGAAPAGQLVRGRRPLRRPRPMMRDYLGERFVEMFTTVKRTEQDRFFEVVPPLDYDWCLKNA